MTEKKCTLGVRVRQETADRIKNDAEREDLDASDIIRRAINKYYEQIDSIKA